jgi:hypothetical protein
MALIGCGARCRVSDGESAHCQLGLVAPLRYFEDLHELPIGGRVESPGFRFLERPYALREIILPTVRRDCAQPRQRLVSVLDGGVLCFPCTEICQIEEGRRTTVEVALGYVSIQKASSNYLLWRTCSGALTLGSACRMTPGRTARSAGVTRASQMWNCWIELEVLRNSLHIQNEVRSLNHLCAGATTTEMSRGEHALSVPERVLHVNLILKAH